MFFKVSTKQFLSSASLTFLELSRYVVLNPVRARMVCSVQDSPWSSYLVTSGQSEVPKFLHIDLILLQFDARRDPAIHAYRRFVNEGRGVEVWQKLRAGSLLGSQSFVEEMRPKLMAIPWDQNMLRR